LWFALNPLAEGFNFQIWQLITYQFMHGGFSHIFFNMLMLWMFGMEIENYWGSKKFLVYYLLCGVVAGLFQLFINPLLVDTPAVTIGASGAVYGVLIAFALMFPDSYIFLYFLVPIKAKYLIGFLIVLEFMLVDSAQSNVAHLAHLGGALAGFLFIMFDKSIDVPLKRMLNISSGYRSGSQFQNPFSGFSDKFKRRKEDIEEAKRRLVSILEQADEKTQEASFSMRHIHKTILSTPDEADNAYLIMSRAAAKAYHGGPDTLLQNVRAMFWFIASHFEGEQVPELTFLPMKEEKIPFAPPREVPRWIKRITKLAVLGSGYYLWQQARDLNNRIMGNNHEGCVVSGMVRIERVTFNIGTFLTAWHYVSNALARIDAAKNYEEFAKSAAFFPGAALLTAVGEAIASKVEV
jgi:membrane associated rhomboid family serine protease